ncbi:DUF3696 domain-containing protein [Aquimarina sp. RZ0]|uniref:AAA family ATPase n=1 Tax=Aquimarina sp. RZ0 TaxID=2607730 RepID=UPI0011F39F09|nr:DUF3696 domain-containing protein [Aquimarina sp. RZ0]KAA1242518.1 DUF3696 domain-containing protein [Aquimarina sp. RZ0]
MLDKIIFKGYKSFQNTNELELKPITILFGKNSSGKSAVAKLPTLIEASLSGEFEEPLRYINNEIELGAEFRDLFYQRRAQEQMEIELTTNSSFLKVKINNSFDKPILTSWEISPNLISGINDDPNKLMELTEMMTEKKELFSGFLLNDNRKIIKDNISLKTDYIGPFRLNPPRVFHLSGVTEFDSIGIKGENAYQILVNDEEIAKKVGEWYETNFDGWKLYVNKISPYYEIRIKHNDSKDDGVNIVDVGQGMSQALPIVVKAFKKEKRPVLTIMEQPELHLHPAAHGSLAELLANSSDKENKYLIETHSENFILRLRTMVAENKIDKSSINLYWVNYDEKTNSSLLKKINISNSGEVDFWPDNVFNESFEEIKALRRAQKK